MKFGIFLRVAALPGPRRSRTASSTLYQNALAQLELADALGYDYAWEVEHHFLEEYSHSSAPEVFLGACSQRTKDIRLGHGIMQLTTNHPAKVAEEGLGARPDLQRPGRAGHGRERLDHRAHPVQGPLRGEARDLGRRGALPDPDVRRRRRRVPRPALRFPAAQRAAEAAPEAAPAAVDRLLPAADHRLCRREGHRRARLPVRQRRRRPCAWVHAYYNGITKRLAAKLADYPINPNIALVSKFMCARTDEEARHKA